MNPYRGLPAHQFWYRGVTCVRPGGLDPLVEAPKIGPTDKVATMGSCFAQHLAKNLEPLGLNYYVAEAPPPGLPAEEAAQRQYGVFSCRFGNIYTMRQAVQLFDRAFGRFAPADDVWDVEGGFVDAFRPRIELVPYANRADVKAATQTHLACVRRMFLEVDWLIVTLGLTEGWRSTIDGAMYPLAPGVAAGNYDSSRYEFINFSATEVSRDVSDLIQRLQQVNPRCRVILTVSPVALVATFEKRHVLVSTAASKAALRVAADEAERAHPNVTYFPSYEIITSSASEGRYFADDCREVNELGVAHVMRIFKNHFVERAPPSASATRVVDVGVMSAGGVVCDEEEIQRSVRESLSQAAPAEIRTMHAHGDGQVSREAVVWAFRFFIGREPSGEEEIAFHQQHANLECLRLAFSLTAEFTEYQQIRRAMSADNILHVHPGPAVGSTHRTQA